MLYKKSKYLVPDIIEFVLYEHDWNENTAKARYLYVKKDLAFKLYLDYHAFYKSDKQ